MIRKLPVLALLIGALAVAGQAQAGGYYYHGGGHGGGGCCWGGGHSGWVGPAAVGAVLGAVVAGSVMSAPRTVYVQQPVYVQPQPVYAPPPVYYQPPPPPVYYQPPGYYVQPRY